MATKSQLIDYISENYNDADGMPVSLPKLDSYKKADLEKFIEVRDDKEDLDKWLENRQ